jgi:hypothetical protein
MNSYWFEHQARSHIDELIADASGDRLHRAANVADATPPDAPTTRGTRPWRRAVKWLQALAARSQRETARAR